MHQEELQRKYGQLKKLIAPEPEVAVAFSGGVDSTLLLHACLEVLGPQRVTALTARSSLMPREELQGALELARSFGVLRHQVVNTPDLEGEAFRNNPRDRCYHCKKEIFSAFMKILKEEKNCSGGGFQPPLLEGTNRDDLEEYRPGRQAVLELGVRSPLLEVELGKKEIRLLSLTLGLPTWDMPSQACLASRIPYGETVDRGKLLQVEKGEAFIKSLGFGECRLRHHGPLARLEVPCRDLEQLTSLSPKITKKIKALGFTYVTLDLGGLLSGSFD